MAAPALPWARPEGCEQERREGGPEAEQQADLSLKAGDRIKVNIDQSHVSVAPRPLQGLLTKTAFLL